MRVNLFTPALPIQFVNKNGSAIGNRMPAQSVFTGLQLRDNNCELAEEYPEDCVMSAIDDSQMMIPATNFGGTHSLDEVNEQIMQISSQNTLGRFPLGAAGAGDNFTLRNPTPALPFMDRRPPTNF